MLNYLEFPCESTTHLFNFKLTTLKKVYVFVTNEPFSKLITILITSVRKLLINLNEDCEEMRDVFENLLQLFPNIIHFNIIQIVIMICLILLSSAPI